MEKIIDLHSHTTCSDGTYTVKELVDYAVTKNLSALAITDHDTVSGIDEAINYASKYDKLELITGIEFSTNEEGFKNDIHILGYYFDYKNKDFANALDEIINGRETRNKKVIKLMQDDGINVTYEDIKALSNDGVITRSHFCRWLVNNGYSKSVDECFAKLLGNGKKYHVKREKVTPKIVIDLVHKAGGMCSLAHPILYKLEDKELDKLVSKLKGYGIDAIEGIYTTYSEYETDKIKKLAKKYDLIITGGSDFHGSNKVGIDLATGYGDLKIPYSILENMKTYLKK